MTMASALIELEGTVELTSLCGENTAVILDKSEGPLGYWFVKGVTLATVWHCKECNENCPFYQIAWFTNGVKSLAYFAKTGEAKKDLD